MGSVEKTIDVNVPVSTAYNQWTQFESFPQFMEGVKEVRQIDDTHLHWRAEIAGKEREWDAVITEQMPDQRIAWTSTSGAHNAGAVTFHYLDQDKCRAALMLDYEPEGIVESVGGALGFIGRQVDGDLKRFKEFVESRGVATGSWRGEVHHGDTKP